MRLASFPNISASFSWSVLLLLLSAACVDSFTMPTTTTCTSHSRSRNTMIKLSPEDLVSILSSPEALQQQIDTLSTLAATGAQTIEELPDAAKAGVFALPLVYAGSIIAPSLQAAPVRSEGEMYPEQNLAAYEMSSVKLPFEFGESALVRPLLKQTQLEYRRVQVVYDANKDGYDAQKFHSKVDGKGAAIVLAKANGQWFGGYNPRGWASLGGSRPSCAAFLFYKKGFFGGWQKVRVMGRGGMACGNDLFDKGIYLGAEGLVIPLDGNTLGNDGRLVASRLGTYFEAPDGGRRGTILPRIAEDTRLQELKVLTGVYEKGEDIPNSGGVLDLGLY